jgi:hypothetical protein
MMQIAKKAFPVLLGAGIGYAYWYFIGCVNGSCPITSNWHTATLYGAIVGATFLLPTKKKTVTPGKEPVEQHAEEH